jgi:hypothetical protein
MDGQPVCKNSLMISGEGLCDYEASIQKASGCLHWGKTAVLQNDKTPVIFGEKI